MSQLKAHFVGSVPLGDPQTVMSEIARVVGAGACRIPDGETGPTKSWMWRFVRLFENNPAFEPTQKIMPHEAAFRHRVKPGRALSPNDIPPLGYVREAAPSYAIFRDLRAQGKIAPGVRFQTSLQTPLALATFFLEPEDRATGEAAIEQRMREEIALLLKTIPADDLAIQWDLCLEAIALEGVYPVHCADPWTDIPKRVAALSDLVPESAQLGAHICYGDYEHKHALEPKDLSVCVRFANALATTTRRRLDWVHMPVPRERDDDAYYAPLDGLKLDARTDLFLGLIHYSDGAEGLERRLAAARRHAGRFGIATECGMGRRDPSTIPTLLKLHATNLNA